MIQATDGGRLDRARSEESQVLTLLVAVTRLGKARGTQSRCLPCQKCSADTERSSSLGLGCVLTGDSLALALKPHDSFMGKLLSWVNYKESA